MTLPQLKADLFYVIVFGPGYGESIVLRSPDDHWFIIDSCEDDNQIPALKLLKDCNAQWDCLILTHPHLDHGLGFDEIINAPGNGPVGCFHPQITDPQEWVDSDDARKSHICAQLEATVSAIQTRWDEQTSSRWDMRRGEHKQFDDVTLTVLHPDQNALNRWPDDLNRISSPILVEWRDLRILLGADLMTPQWNSIPTNLGPLNDHALLKVPHHGSQHSFSPRFTQGADPTGFWVVTPYNRGHKLPRYGTGRGLAQLLNHVDDIHLTALPDNTAVPTDQHFIVSRQTLSGDELMSSPIDQVGGLDITGLTPQRPKSDYRHYIAAGFDHLGHLRECTFGPGSISIV